MDLSKKIRRKRKPEQVMIKEQVVTKKGGRQTVAEVAFVETKQPGLPVDYDTHLHNVPTPAFPVNMITEHILTEEVPQEPSVCQHQKKEDLQNNWAAINKDMKIAHITAQAMFAYGSCPQCGVNVDDETPTCLVKCEDCNRYMCDNCADIVHEYQPLHSLKILNKDGKYSSYSYDRVFKLTLHNCSGYKRQDDVEVVDDRGKIFTCTVEYCSCTALPVYLVTIGLWPSTPLKPTRAYHQGFLTLLVYLMLEGHMSLQAACQSFRWKNDWSSKTAESIYQQLTTEECYEEFRHFHYKMRTLDGLCVENDCPACPKETGQRFVSLNANFGLVRKSNAGKSAAGPKHGSQLFVSDDEVSSFVTQYDVESGKKETSDCHHFQAGDTVRSKNKALQLDKTGVFGAICRHGFPVKFMNMEHGERYAYPVLMLEKLIEEKAGTKLTISYDIACKLKAHLQKKKRKEILENVKLVLPCWHAYGHNASCQVEYSTRMVDDCGLTDGEEMERLWSYLRPFSHITKEMTPSHRVDLLSDALLHYGREKAADIIDALQQRWDKVCVIHRKATEELRRLIGGMYKTTWM